MTSHDLRRLATCFVTYMSEGADWPAWEDLIADDCVYIMHGTTPVSGSREGKPAILALNEQLLEVMTGDMGFAIHDVIVDGNRAVILLTGVGTTRVAHAVYQNEYCWVLRFRDGRVVEWQEYMDTALTERTLAAEVSALGRRQLGLPAEKVEQHG